MNYRSFRAMAPAFVLLYFAGGLILFPDGQEDEIFPFFTWSLFTESADPQFDFVLRISEIDGEKLPEPTNYFDLSHRFINAQSRNIIVAKLADRMAAAAIDKNNQELQRHRIILESKYMAEARSLKYDLVAIRYSPIERYRTGKVRHSWVMASFEKSND